MPATKSDRAVSRPRGEVYELRLDTDEWLDYIPVRIGDPDTYPGHQDRRGYCGRHETEHVLIYTDGFAVEIEGVVYDLPDRFAVSACPICVPGVRADEGAEQRSALRKTIRLNWEDDELREAFDRRDEPSLEERVERLEGRVDELERRHDHRERGGGR